MFIIAHNVYKSPGFSKMDTYNAKREWKHLNARSKCWRNFYHGQNRNQSRLNNLNVDATTDTKEPDCNRVKTEVVSLNPDISKHSSKDCNGISSNNPEKFLECQTCQESALRPKHLNLDRNFYSSTSDKASHKKSPPETKPSKGSLRVKVKDSNGVNDGDCSLMTKRQTYTSDYLLGLRKVPPSLEKPDLPPIPGIILCKPVLLPPSSVSINNQDALPTLHPASSTSLQGAPGRPQSPKSNQRHRGVKSSSSSSFSRGKRKRPDVPPPPLRRIISLNLNGEVSLHTSENAWRAGSVGKATPDSGTGKNLEVTCCKLRGLLNKLSAANFDVISDRIARLDVRDEGAMMTIIDIIFEKAVTEPNFSELYAALARKFSQWTVPSDRRGRAKLVTFKDLVITRCQHEFEKHKYGESEADVPPADGDCNAVGGRSEIDAMDALKKKRTLGNIRFIGELFMQDMLQEVVIHNCILDLLKYRLDEDRLESLCRMLTVVGRKIDFVQSKPRIDQYFRRISDILSRKDISSRIKFMLRDIVELRGNHWIPRHLKARPQLARQSSAYGHEGNNGWGAPIARSASVIEDGRACGTLPRNFAFNQRQQQQQQQQQQQHQQQQQQLGRTMTATRRGPGPREVVGFEVPSPTSRGKFVPRECNGTSHSSSLSPGKEVEKWDTKSHRVVGSTRDLSRSLHPAKEEEEEKEKGRKDKGLPGRSGFLELTAEQLDRKYDHFLNEYLNVKDFEEAGLFFDEMRATMVRCCKSLVVSCLEKNSADRSNLGDLFIFALSKGHLSADTLVKSLEGVLCCSEDLEIDIPKVWEYLSEIFFQVVLVDHDDLLLSRMFGEASALMTGHFEKMTKFLSNTLKVVGDKKGPREACHLHAKINAINDRCRVDGFQVDATNSDDLTASPNFSRKYAEKLKKILQLEEWFPEAKLQQFEKDVLREEGGGREAMVSYAKLLVGLVAEEVTSGGESSSSYSIDVCKLRSSCGHLRRLTGGQQQQEEEEEEEEDHHLGTEVLDAVQQFVCRIDHPCGILRGFFDVLYDEDVVSEEDLDRWWFAGEEGGSAPAPGRGIAKESVVKFFEWLRQSEEEQAPERPVTS